MKARTRMIKAKISKRSGTRARSGAWRKRKARETVKPTTPMATMDERMSLISRATIDPRIMNPKRKISHVSMGTRSSLSWFSKSGQDAEQQDAEQDEEHIDLEKPRVGFLQEV